MSLLGDPRVKRWPGTEEDVYEVFLPGGSAQVWNDGHAWVAMPPAQEGQYDESDEFGYRNWVKSLPRFATVEEALAEVVR